MAVGHIRKIIKNMPKSPENFDFSKKEDQTKFEKLPKEEKETYIEMAHDDALEMEKYYGPMFEEFKKVGATELAKQVMEEIEGYKELRTRSMGLNDVYINENDRVAAVLLEEHTWGGSGGIEWNLDLKLQKDDEKAILHFFSVRTRSNSKDDMPQFWYKKLDEIKYEEGHFFVKFSGDDEWWNIESGKKYSVSRNNIREVVVGEDKTDIAISAPGEKDIYLKDIPNFEVDKLIDEHKKKYGDGFRYTEYSNTKEEKPVRTMHNSKVK